jgi:general secretion pathway protein A
VRELPVIDQRIGLRYHLRPMSSDEVGAYVEARMRAAGSLQESVFSEEAKITLYEETGGIPREINRVCKLALDKTFSLGQQKVEAEIITQIATDVFQQDPVL